LAVLGELASGGMGRVDLARVIGAEEWVVAVKRLHPHLARDAHFVAMFLDEVRVAGSLRHPNIVELVGWGKDDDGTFLAMEFVYGAPLSHVAKSGRDAGDPMPEPLIAYVGARVAEGLGAAHDLRAPTGEPLGVIHRDVSPSNVLLGFDGTVKITDFGVAKATGRATHTATGVLKGKVSYMSPEYAKGRGFDSRADLYSEGVVLFELATGARPFHAEHDFELLRMIAEQPPPPIAAFEPRFEPSLANLIHRLLEKNPAHRPQDGEAVRRELDGWLAERRLQSRQMEQRLGAYVQKHAADRRGEIAELLAMQGEEVPREDTPPARMRTLTELYTEDQRAATIRQGRPARRRDEGPKTRPVGVRSVHTPVSQDSGPRGATVPLPAVAREPASAAALAAVAASPLSLEEQQESVVDAKTLLFERRERSAPRDRTGVVAADEDREPDETTTVAVKAPSTDRWAAKRSRPARVEPTLPPPPRARLLAAAVVSFVIVAALMSVLLAAAMGRRGEAPEQDADAADTAVPSKLSRDEQPAAPPSAAATATASPVSAVPEPPVAGAVAEPPVAEPPAAAATAATAAAGVRPKPSASKRCTPADFDYPRCLKPR
jgi:serine/threonine-protein kinase